MNASQATYEFGPFRLDGNKKLLWRYSQAVALTPKVMDTLVVLIELRERVVTKDELLGRVWGDTVVEEGGLARNISILRKALGEKPDEHTYIVTVPGRGYRFVAAVRETAGSEVVREGPTADARTGKRRLLRWLLLGGLAALAAGALVVFLLRHPSGARAAQPAITSLAVLPLANLSGGDHRRRRSDQSEAGPSTSRTPRK
jgi:DNA-binding winged helix-turn-helix (wHTH) protein